MADVSPDLVDALTGRSQFSFDPRLLSLQDLTPVKSLTQQFRGAVLPPVPTSGSVAESYHGVARSMPEPPRPSDAMAPVAEALSPTLAGYGLGQAAGATYLRGRDADYAGAAREALPLALAALPIPGAKRVPRVETPIRAYHGSPHDFDQFDLSKIGTGEGAQTYGHGLYFAENEGVARNYRDSLATPHPAQYYADYAMHLGRGDPDAAIRALATARVNVPEDGAAIARAARIIRGKEKPIPTGRMYDVAIHADPESFLDWDKPLSQQSDAIKAALIKAYGSKAGIESGPLNALIGRITSWPMRTIGTVSDLIAHHPEQALLREQLAKAGIPGIKYFDQGSRGKGDGTHNYVVFNPDIIEILRKYGIALPFAGPAAMGALNQAQPQQ